MKQSVHRARILCLLYAAMMITASLTVTTTQWGLANAQQQNNETRGPQSMAANTQMRT
jgi:hypothetical protein